MKFTPTLFLLLCCFIFACQNEPQQASTDKATNKTVTKEATPVQKTLSFSVNIDQLRLRDSPGTKGKEVAKLTEGTKLYDLDEVSKFTTSVKLRGIQFDEPWIKVKTDQNQEGWVYAGGININDAQELLKKRLTSFFGSSITQELVAYQQAFHNISSSDDFQATFQRGADLRDTLLRTLSVRIQVEDTEVMPDLSWLETAIPGYQTSIVAEGTEYYLFADFKDWNQKAQATNSAIDNEFIDLCFLVHAADSVEYFYPSWYLQTWDYGGHSLLGQGQHKKILEKMDRIIQQDRLFQTQIDRIKEDLINDMINPDVSYWESQSKILAELDAIIAADFQILTEKDKIALKTRRQMFKDYKKNNIELDHRSGSN